jgi:RNA polymerase sigma-70 factor (ECF subfamily)
VEEARPILPSVSRPADEAAVDPELGLIDQAIAGDAEAFAALYDRHVDRVYRHVYYHLGNQADAEDVTQQVFLRAWQAISRYRRTNVPFIVWLLTIAHNLVVSHYRRSKETRPLDEDPPMRGHGSDPESSVLTRYDREIVRRAILRLKPDYQKVIVLRFIEGIGYDVVAAALGKSEGAVRVIQHRALLELRRLIEHEVKV